MKITHIARENKRIIATVSTDMGYYLVQAREKLNGLQFVGAAYYGEETPRIANDLLQTPQGRALWRELLDKIEELRTQGKGR